MIRFSFLNRRNLTPTLYSLTMKSLNFTKYIPILLAVFLSFGLLVACSDDDNGIVDQGPDGPQPEEPNLAELAQSDDDFSTLVSILVDLDLVDALTSDDDLTVFAPTNSAFEAISDAIPGLTDEDLEAIVLYHITEGTILSSGLEASQEVTMLQGEQTLVQSSAAGVQINAFANVVEADLQASNGVIHAIDQVLLPDEYRIALQGPSLLEVAGESGDFDTLLSIIDEAGLTLTLKYLTFTAFAPTDDVFEGFISSLNFEPSEEELAFILTYHVLFGETLSSDLAPEQTVSTVSEELLYITSANGSVYLNGGSETAGAFGGANVVAADIDDATNGVIHVIDNVLLPNPFIPVPGVVAKNYDLSTLLSLVAARPDVLEALSDPNGLFTVFAPNNDAFGDVLSENPDLNEDQVNEILFYHVLAGASVLSGDLEETQTVETLGEEDIYVTVDNGNVMINNSATVATADLEGNNGVVHIIDGVLLPNAFLPVTGIVQKNYNLSTLLSLVAEREDILEALSGDGEFTVFAPTDEAFETALEAFPDLTDEQITEILTYHVLGAQVLSADLSDGQTAETLQGEEITVSINDGVQINNANVVTADLIGTNGVVHIIDAVILPPSYTE
jgi:transforming growth factor-beta-induced protein